MPYLRNVLIRMMIPMILGLFYCLPLMAQSPQKLQDLGQQSFVEKNYTKALNYFLQAGEKGCKSKKLQFQIGRTYFELCQYSEALKYFKVYLGYKNHEDLALWYTAKAMHFTENWDAALRFYKLYLKALSQNDPMRFEVKKSMMQCLSAEKLQFNQVPVVVATLGDSVNSSFDEQNIIQHPKNTSAYFFSSNRTGDFDIYQALSSNGNWKGIHPLSNRYNQVASDEIILSLPDNGYQMLYFREEEHEKIGRARIDNYGDYQTKALDIPFAFGQEQWNGDHYFFSDSLVLFSAITADGIGGKDLYYMILKQDGYWSKPVNLGAEINSPFNERCPFLAKDGRTLYFSADVPNSIGGYDVYKSIFIDSLASWSAPTHAGVPLNGFGDDLFFNVSEDGTKGYLSSVRSGGFGGFDIYGLYFRKPLREQLNNSTPSSFVAFEDQEKPVISSIEDVEKLFHQLQGGNNPNASGNRYKLGPIFYNGERGEWQKGADKTIAQLQQLLLNHKEVKVLLTAHSDDVNSLNSNLFLSVQQANKLAEELLKTGVEAQQIHLRGCGQQYPIAKNYNFDGSPNKTGRILNQRIDIQLFNTKNSNFTVEMQEPMVSAVMQESMAEQYKKNTAGLCYKVQLLETPNMLNHELLDQVKDSHAEKTASSPSITYCIGMAKQFVAIQHIHTTAVEMGFEGAKIVPYINGIPINRIEAQSLENNFPDLKKYLEATKE